MPAIDRLIAFLEGRSQQQQQQIIDALTIQVTALVQRLEQANTNLQKVIEGKET